MNGRMLMAAIAAIAVWAMTPGASAQDCTCDCYFSFDCVNNAACNYGNLSIEDSCWWRHPKPNGAPGAGCELNQIDWGWCDGACANAQEVTTFSKEKISSLQNGVLFWSQALNDAAVSGGGLPDPADVALAEQIEYVGPMMSDLMWRITTEVLVMIHGFEILEFPQAEKYRSAEVRIGDLSNDPQLVQLGNLAVQALIAEIRDVGSGRRFIAEIAKLGLDQYLYDDDLDLICLDEPDRLNCMYGRIVNLGDALGRGGRDFEMQEQGFVGCGACPGDIQPNDKVDTSDLLAFLEGWGGNGGPADINDDGSVNVTDLLMLLERWGPCAPGP